MIDLLVGDCASDPPLSATLRTLAVWQADEVVLGLGAVALERGARRLSLVARHPDAYAALAQAVARLGARVEVLQLPDAWPPALPAGAAVVSAETLLEAAARAQRRTPRPVVTVHGAVRDPAVLPRQAAATVSGLVEAAGGATVPDWVVVSGGASGGRLVDRDTPSLEAGGSLLVLPAGHAVVRRLRTSVADWLLRAASACEACRACTDGCPQIDGDPLLEPHAVVQALAVGRDPGTRMQAATRCTGCGLCDALCPSSLSPRALVVSVRDRLASAGFRPAPPRRRRRPLAPRPRPGLDVGLLTLRLGLGPYDRAPAVRI